MEIQEHGSSWSAPLGRPALSCLLCLTASTALLLPLDVVERSLGDAPRLAWCALFWVATLSLPQAERGSARWPVGFGLCMCVLGLAVHLDLSRGAAVPELWAIAWPTLLFAVLLAGAASRARKTGTAARHALLWFLLVLGAPLIAHTLERWGGVLLPGWLEFIAAASPLDWLAGRVGGVGSEPWLPLGVAVLLFSSSSTSLDSAEEVPG